MNKKMSRRDFLKLAGVTSAGLALSACGVKATEIPMLTNAPTQTFTPEATKTLTPSPTPEPTATKTPKYLRDYAERLGFNIGVLVGGYGFAEYYGQLIKLQGQEFNLGMVYLDMKLTQPEQDKFTLKYQDSDFQLTTKNKMKSLGHPLIWYDAVPDWVKSNNSRDDLLNVMVNHITKMMKHYKGKMNSWVVVNEAYVDSRDIFYNKIGADYVEIAFETARNTDPSAILIYNEFDNHIEKGEYTEHTRTIVDKLQSRGLIDAVGLQMHLQGSNPPDKQDVISTMKSYGIPVYVTEFDVNMKDIGGTQEDRFSQQDIIYKNMHEAALESQVCKDFLIFGLVDKLSVWEYLPNLWAYSQKADPVPFDDNFQPKPAYFAMLDVFKNALG